jgi:hypothetical protein
MKLSMYHVLKRSLSRTSISFETKYRVILFYKANNNIDKCVV